MPLEVYSYHCTTGPVDALHSSPAVCTVAGIYALRFLLETEQRDRLKQEGKTRIRMTRTQ